MAKRFTETGKWADPWFQDLKPAYKCAWSYILDNCDNAGIWVVNTKLLSFQVGEALTWIDLKETMGDRLVEFAPGRVWVPKFIDFQYGKLTPACKPHQKVIFLLKGYGLWEGYSEKLKGYTKGIDTLEEEEEDQDKEEEKEKEEEGGPGETKPPALPVRSEEAVAHAASAKAAAGMTSTDADRALRVLALYPDRAKDGRAVAKTAHAQNLLASRIATNRGYAWEEHAELERQNHAPKDAHTWAQTMPDPVALEHLRKLKSTPIPPKPGERPHKTLKALT